MPGFVFQSVIIGGGYGTGRELVEFFLKNGTWGGLLGMVAVSTVMFSLVLAVTFEFARAFKAFDYRTFFKELLGPAWFLFEIFFFVLMFIVLAVVGSAAGVLLEANFGIPYFVGVIIMLAAVGFLTFKGSGLIEKFLSLWSMLLYAIYVVFVIIAVTKFGPVIRSNFAEGTINSGWVIGGFKYALYNLGIIPAVLFCLKHLKTRKEALTAGLLGGPIAIIPGLLFYFAVVGFYPAVLQEEIPVVFILVKAGVPFLLIVFQVILFGTLIETGTGFIHSVNERIQSELKSRNKELRRWQRPIIALIILLIAFLLSSFGIIDLIAKGYGAVSWGFFFVFIIPLLTWGIIKLKKAISPPNPTLKGD